MNTMKQECRSGHTKKTEDGFDVYSNNCYIPYGFTYDKYVSYKKNCDALSSAQRANMMVKALLLTNEQIEKNTAIFLTEADGSNYMLNSDELKKDAADRAATAAYSFCHDNSDFKAKINLKSKKTSCSSRFPTSKAGRHM